MSTQRFPLMQFIDCAEYYMNHTLQVLVDNKDIRAFRLCKNSKQIMESTLLIFTREGVSICGDLAPGQRGVFSLPGYDLDWFVGDHNPEYLCSKFLTKEWDSDATYKGLCEEIQELKIQLEELQEQSFLTGSEREKLSWLRTVIGSIENVKEYLSSDLISSEEEFYATWIAEVDGYRHDEVPSRRFYNPRDAELLVAIQKTFRRLWGGNSDGA